MHDPNHDLFFAIPTNDEPPLRQAIDAGGSLSTDDRGLLKKYEKLLKDHKFERKIPTTSE